MRILQLVLSLLFATSVLISSNAQADNITITFTEKPFGEILKELKGRYNLNFSYDQNLSILKRTISISAKEVAPHEFLKTLFEKAGANYKVIDGHVAISERSASTRSTAEETNTKSRRPSTVNLKKKEPEEKTHSENQIPPVAEQELLTDRSIQATRVVKPVNPSHKFDNEEKVKEGANLSSTTSTNTESNEKPEKNSPRGELAFGALGSLDFYHFTRPTFEGSKGSFSTPANFSVGALGRYTFSEKWFLELQLRLARRNFDQNYNFRTIESGDPFVIDKTTFQLLYANVPLNVDYRIFQKRNLSVYVNAGTSFDWLIRDELTTTFKDGNKTTAPADFGKPSSFMLGLQGGLQVQYALSEQLKINLSPVYRQYFGKFNDGPSGIEMRMISLEVGLVLF